jgi:hypothetical protein
MELSPLQQDEAGRRLIDSVLLSDEALMDI